MILSSKTFKFKAAISLDQSPLAMSSRVGLGGWAACYSGGKSCESVMAFGCGLERSLQ